MSIVYNGLTTIQMIKQCLSYITDSLLYKWSMCILYNGLTTNDKAMYIVYNGPTTI